LIGLKAWTVRIFPLFIRTFDNECRVERPKREDS
jgi:hypothetical protein